MAITMVADKVSFEENLFRGHDKDITERFKNLAHICEIHFEFNEAKKYLNINSHWKAWPEHVDVATSYNRLGLICDFEKAKKYQQLALAITLNKLGPEHIDVAVSYSNLSSIYKDLGDLKQVKEYQQCVLAIKLDKLGPDHGDVAVSYNNLSLIYKKLGDLNQAKEYQ